MSKSTYLGSKGYTIRKDEITIREQQYLRDELTITPFIANSPIKPPSFSVYRESTNKMYLPRYFGESTYGIFDETKLLQNEEIQLKLLS